HQRTGNPKETPEPHPTTLRLCSNGGGRRGLRHASTQLCGDVLAAFEIRDQRLDREDRSPGNPPPTGDQADQTPGQSLRDRALSRGNKVNVGGAAKAHDQNGNGVLVEDELPAPLNYELEPVRRHSFDALNLQDNSPLECAILGRPQRAVKKSKVIRPLLCL